MSSTHYPSTQSGPTVAEYYQQKSRSNRYWLLALVGLALGMAAWAVWVRVSYLAQQAAITGGGQ